MYYIFLWKDLWNTAGWLFSICIFVLLDTATNVRLLYSDWHNVIILWIYVGTPPTSSYPPQAIQHSFLPCLRANTWCVLQHIHTKVGYTR